VSALEIDLEDFGFSNFKKLIDLIMPTKERKKNTIIIGYMQIYTHLNGALNLMRKDTCKRAFEHITIARKLIRQIKFEEENPYLKRLIKTLDYIIKNQKKIFKGIKKNESSDPSHVKTSLLLAENICILRILKINKY